ncbi:hypothetical protein BDD12DRAFT_843318 [Trichophaea hybrida]|nr:hypothetical protein BDD12DRAFT_843318 [Trichophaea hybrida]
MQVLLSTHPNIQITEPILTAAAGNSGNGKEVMELLLSTHPDIQITEPIVTAAAGNSGNGKEVMKLLLSTHPDIQITEKAVATIAQNFDGGIMKLLLSTHPGIQITEKAVATIAQNFDGGIMKLLLSTHPDILITEPIVTAAARNSGNGKELMELLLSTHPNIQITEPIVTAPAGNSGNGKEVMELLLSTHPDILITEPIEMAAAGNSGNGKEVMELLLSTHPDIQIIEPIVTAVARNWRNGKEVMELLLSTHPDIQMTEPIVTAAAGNSGNGKEVMITEPIVTAAACNRSMGNEVIELLMACDTNTRVHASAVKAAAYFGRSYWFGKLFAKCNKVSIVNEQYQQYLGAAVEGGDQDILKSLLDLGGQPSGADSSTSYWTLSMVAAQSRNLWALKQLGDVPHGALNQPDPPTAWVNDYTSIELEYDSREIIYQGKRCSVIGNRPFPPGNLGVNYFEISIREGPRHGAGLNIGFCGGHFLQTERPGYYIFSSAYFSNGYRKSGSGGWEKYGPNYATNDVVGCGIDWETERYFFTLNGRKLESIVSTDLRRRIYPVVGFSGRDRIYIRANFGGPFKYDPVLGTL